MADSPGLNGGFGLGKDGVVFENEGHHPLKVVLSGKFEELDSLIDIRGQGFLAEDMLSRY